MLVMSSNRLKLQMVQTLYCALSISDQPLKSRLVKEAVKMTMEEMSCLEKQADTQPQFPDTTSMYVAGVQSVARFKQKLLLIVT